MFDRMFYAVFFSANETTPPYLYATEEDAARFVTGWDTRQDADGKTAAERYGKARTVLVRVTELSDEMFPDAPVPMARDYNATDPLV